MLYAITMPQKILPQEKFHLPQKRKKNCQNFFDFFQKFIPKPVNKYCAFKQIATFVAATNIAICSFTIRKTYDFSNFSYINEEKITVLFTYTLARVLR